ncbi:DUF1656 domain-containing protein [Microvirga sp. W0021]|uniref:DUF1656 domain-containing protein n=1 Tax=Hohaiivirga grylli TaxID=3133970 RepID=A0ABV0BI52_9HYPH
MLKELDIFGILVAPLALYISIGVLLFIIVKRLIRYFHLERYIWHSSLFDVTLFVLLISVVTLFALYPVS